MASRDPKTRSNSAKPAPNAAAKPGKTSTGSLVTAQLLNQLKNSAQKTSSTQPPVLAPVEPVEVPVEPLPAPAPTRAAAYLNAAPTPAPVVVAEPARAGAHPGGGHARVISITLTPYDLQLCERIRARFQDTTLAPSRSEILKLALHALELDDEGLIEALLAVRERDGRRRKLEPGEQAPAAHYPASPTPSTAPAAASLGR